MMIVLIKFKKVQANIKYAATAWENELFIFLDFIFRYFVSVSNLTITL